MKEILMINVGQAGIRIGDQTWQKLTNQHNINKNGQQISEHPLYDNLTVFNESAHQKFVPRNIFVDTDPESIDQIKRGQRRGIYKPSAFISCKEDSSNNYIRGHMTIGKSIIDQTLDQVRKLIESCNYFEGFIFNHALSGGTGCGFANLLLERLECQAFAKKKTVISNLVCPSPNISDTIVEPYNVNLGLGDLTQKDSQKIINCFDNQKLYKKCEQLGIESPGYYQVNELIAQSISLITHHFRLQQTINSLQEIHNNTVPYKNICFLSPKLHEQTLARHQRSLSFIENMWKEQKCLSSYREYTNQRVDFSMATFLRGFVPKIEVYQQFQQYKRNVNWINWCQTGFKLFSNEIHANPSQYFIEGLTLTNNNSMTGLLHRWNLKYDHLFQKRAFVHWYVGQGIQDEDFAWSRQYTAQLQKDYVQASVFLSRNQDDVFVNQ